MPELPEVAVELGCRMNADLADPTRNWTNLIQRIRVHPRNPRSSLKAELQTLGRNLREGIDTRKTCHEFHDFFYHSQPVFV